MATKDEDTTTANVAIIPVPLFKKKKKKKLSKYAERIIAKRKDVKEALVDRKYTQPSFASKYAHGGCSAFALAAKKYLNAVPHVMYNRGADATDYDSETPMHAFFKYKGKYYDAYGVYTASDKGLFQIGQRQYQYIDKNDIDIEVDKGGKLIKKTWPYDTSTSFIEEAWAEFLNHANPKNFPGIKVNWTGPIKEKKV